MGPLTPCNCEMVKSLLEGALIGALGRGEAEAGEELLCEHVCLENEVCVKSGKTGAYARRGLG